MEKLKVFYDTEFIERGGDYPIELISIGMITEDGRELYLQNSECKFETANEWVKENVIKNLEHCIVYDDRDVNDRNSVIQTSVYDERLSRPVSCWRTRAEIKQEIIDFIGGVDIELHGFYADYDHVILSQLFGTMMDLPKNFPMFTMDIKQRCVSLGNPKLPKQESGEHNALDDARWNRDVYEWLNQYEIPKLVAAPKEEIDELLKKMKALRNSSTLIMPDHPIARLDAVSTIKLPESNE